MDVRFVSRRSDPAVASSAGAALANAIKYDYPMFSKPMTSAEFSEALSGAEAGDQSRGY